MNFTNPEVLFCLFVLPLIYGLLVRSYRSGRTELLKVGGEWRGRRLASVYLLKSFLSGLGLLLCFLFLIFALSGPSWGSTPVEEPEDGLDVALCVDVSRSMTATDVKPSRLDQAREAVRFLIHSFPNARFSLVAFKGGGITLAPLTPDQTLIEQWLDELSPSLTTSAGTDLESGVLEALQTVDFPTSRHKVIVVVSDGENRNGDLVSAARTVASRGVSIYTLGVGTLEGTNLYVNNALLKDDLGFPVVTRLNPGSLKTLSDDTEGKFFQGLDRTQLRDLQSVLASLSNPAARGGVKLEPLPQFRFFLFLAVGAFCGYLIVRIFPWKGIF